MTEQKNGKEPDPRIVYADIINLPHYQSVSRPPMSLYDRAAQFSSYKALTGYEDMVAEEARLTDDEMVLEEYERSRLDQKLSLASEAIRKGEHPTLTLTVFIPDASKSGGRYAQVTDTVRRIDYAARKIILTSTGGRGQQYKTIDFDRIRDILDYNGDSCD